MTGGELLFWLMASVTCASAIAVVVSQNVVRMAFYLVLSLGSTSALFFLLHADFVGATQLLIYVGGTVVLLIFGVMLTASGPFVQIKTSPAEGILGGGVGALLLTVIIATVLGYDWPLAASPEGGATLAATPEGNTGRALGLSFLGLRPDRDLGSPEGPLSTGYLLPFEIVSVHLLVVLIGAAYLARAKRRVDSSAPPKA